MIKLHERSVILLIRPEVLALWIKTLANNKILNRAPRATVSDKNVKCKQSENRVNKGQNQTKVSPAHQITKRWWKFRYLGEISAFAGDNKIKSFFSE